MASYKTHQRMTLQKTDLISMLNEFSIYDLAEKFNVSRSMIYSELTNQFKIKTIGFSTVEPKKEVDLSVGAWMDSPERKSLIEFRTNKI